LVHFRFFCGSSGAPYFCTIKAGGCLNEKEPDKETKEERREEHKAHQAGETIGGTKLNRTGIEWCDYTWNPITGCTRNCPYCYARRMAYRLKGRYGYPEDNPFTPTFHPDRLLEPLKVKKPSKIFTVSMGEMFDKDVPELWRDLVLRIMFEARQHTFLVLTKQPRRVSFNHEEYVPTNLWVGVSQDGMTTSIEDICELDDNAQVPPNFVSCEPLLGPVDLPEYNSLKWVIIGAQTGAGAKQPRKEWVQHLASQAIDQGIPIFIKDNVNMSEADRVQEWPEAMK